MRSAISRSRDVARATSKLATLAQAMSNTSMVTEARTHNARSKSSRNPDGPFAADRKWTRVLMNCSIRSRDSAVNIAVCSRRKL